MPGTAVPEKEPPMIRMIVLLVLIAVPAAAADRSEGPPGAYTRNLACRIAVRAAGAGGEVRALADVNLDASGGNKADATFHARLPRGRTLTAVVQHVYVTQPRDRFNVTMLLDGKPHLRLNHLDLDLFVETTIEGEAYMLHCFPEIEGEAVAPEKGL
jgi:hypothetical protein